MAAARSGSVRSSSAKPPKNHHGHAEPRSAQSIGYPDEAELDSDLPGEFIPPPRRACRAQGKDSVCNERARPVSVMLWW
jgi:hypothetical protein